MITQYTYGNNVEASMSNNVIQRYKKWAAAEIRADLDTRRTGLVTIFENVEHNINISCGIRSNNAFLGKAVYVVGRHKLDRRGTVGTHHYEHVFHSDSLNEVIDSLHDDGYKVYAVDNWEEYNPKNLMDEKLPYKSAFLFGEEQHGLSKESIDLCDDMVYIRQFGSVRSINVSNAAACVMYEYTRQWRNTSAVMDEKK